MADSGKDMDCSEDKLCIDFLKNKNIDGSVRIKYIEEHFKNKKYKHDNKFRDRIEKFRKVKFSIFILFPFIIFILISAIYSIREFFT